MSYFQVRKNHELKPTDHSIYYCVSSPVPSPCSYHRRHRRLCTCDRSPHMQSHAARDFGGSPRLPGPTDPARPPQPTLLLRLDLPRDTNPFLEPPQPTRSCSPRHRRRRQLLLFPGQYNCVSPLYMTVFPHDMAVVPFMLVVSPSSSSSRLSCALLLYPLSIHPTHPCTYA